MKQNVVIRLTHWQLEAGIRGALDHMARKFEAHHKAEFTDDAIEACVRLSSRYLTGRFLPDKAIDIMDEAGSKARITAMTRPPAIKEFEGEIEKIAEYCQEDVRVTRDLYDFGKRNRGVLVSRFGGKARKVEVEW